jgi:class 3 adenylate cyclase
MNLLRRFRGFLEAQDEALNAIGGGSPRQTISGTVGRALLARIWWASPPVVLVDGMLEKGRRAVLVMDSIGFSRLQERDPAAAVRDAHAFWALGERETQAAGGEFIRGWADNFVSVFPTIAQAYAAARAVQAIRASGAGVGFGPLTFEPWRTLGRRDDPAPASWARTRPCRARSCPLTP